MIPSNHKPSKHKCNRPKMYIFFLWAIARGKCSRETLETPSGTVLATCEIKGVVEWQIVGTSGYTSKYDERCKHK